jgi:hypothetical protein
MKATEKYIGLLLYEWGIDAYVWQANHEMPIGPTHPVWVFGYRGRLCMLAVDGIPTDQAMQRFLQNAAGVGAFVRLIKEARQANAALATLEREMGPLE